MCPWVRWLINEFSIVFGKVPTYPHKPRGGACVNKLGNFQSLVQQSDNLVLLVESTGQASNFLNQPLD